MLDNYTLEFLEATVVKVEDELKHWKLKDNVI